MSAASRVYDSHRRRAPALEELADVVEYRSLIAALVERNLKVRYKRSVLGVVWTLLSPAAMIAALSLVFSTPFARQAPSYPAFAAPGIILWAFFAQTTSGVAGEVAGGVDLWRRVRFPRTALAAATVLTGLANLVFALVPLLVLMALSRRPLGPPLASLPLTIILTGIFVFGAALLLAAVALSFPDVADLWTLLLPALMFTAPVAYPASIVTGRAGTLLRLNPMTHFVEAFRAPLYSGTAPSPGELGAMALVAGGTLAAGWLLFTRRAGALPYRG